MPRLQRLQTGISCTWLIVWAPLQLDINRECQVQEGLQELLQHNKLLEQELHIVNRIGWYLFLMRASANLPSHHVRPSTILVTACEIPTMGLNWKTSYLLLSYHRFHGTSMSRRWTTDQEIHWRPQETRNTPHIPKYEIYLNALLELGH